MHLTAFNARALTDVTAAVKNLEAQGAAELILDLRDNRGGLVQEGIEIAKLFLEGELSGSPVANLLPRGVAACWHGTAVGQTLSALLWVATLSLHTYKGIQRQ